MIAERTGRRWCRSATREQLLGVVAAVNDRGARRRLTWRLRLWRAQASAELDRRERAARLASAMLIGE